VVTLRKKQKKKIKRTGYIILFSMNGDFITFQNKLKTVFIVRKKLFIILKKKN
jgi:hypothetical protein